jgi:hypothetical protein
MSNKQDQEFLIQAADQKLRTEAIAAISKRRTVLIWAVAIVTIGIFAAGFIWRQPDIYSVIVCSILWILLYKSDSDLKLLQIVEQLRRDANPVA